MRIILHYLLLLIKDFTSFMCFWLLCSLLLEFTEHTNQYSTLPLFEYRNFYCCDVSVSDLSKEPKTTGRTEVVF